jgi:hypothetical protein
MSKLQLIANPTFKVQVDIAVPGASSVPVEFEFKHRTKPELANFIKSSEGRSDAATFKECVVGWGLSDDEGSAVALTDANIATFLDNYIGASVAVYQTYIEELVKAKAKN